MTEEDALARLKVILATANPSPNNAATAVCIYPDDISQIKQISSANLPIVIIERMTGKWEKTGRSSFGEDRHGWIAQIKVFVHEYSGGTEMTYQSEEDAAANVKSKYWRAAIKDVLYNDITLNGTATYIGNGAGDLFDSILDYEPLMQAPYWALVIELPIVQQNPQVMS